MSNQSRYPVDPELVAVGVNVKPEGMIADEVLPRLPPITKSEFRYNYFPSAQAFIVPDTAVGRKGRVNQVEHKGEQRTGEVFDYGLEEPIAAKDQQDVSWNEQSRAVEYLTNLIRLDREVRVAGRVFDAATYETGLKENLADGSRFDDLGYNPLPLMMDYLDRTLMRVNKLIFGQQAWTSFRTNPAVVKAIHPNGDGSGLVTREQVADLLEVKQIVVGQSFVNTARKGQAATFARAWGKSVAGLYLDPTADATRGATFGFTVVQSVGGNTFLAGAEPDKNIGLYGGYNVRCGESVAEVVSAPSLGFFLGTVRD